MQFITWTQYKFLNHIYLFEEQGWAMEKGDGIRILSFWVKLHDPGRDNAVRRSNERYFFRRKISCWASFFSWSQLLCAKRASTRTGFPSTLTKPLWRIRALPWNLASSKGIWILTSRYMITTRTYFMLHVVYYKLLFDLINIRINLFFHRAIWVWGVYFNGRVIWTTMCFLWREWKSQGIYLAQIE